jgi:hypothetical protein
MTSGPRVHLRAEAARDAEDLVAAIQRLRPSWIRPVPRRLALIREIDDFWTKQLPRRSKYDPDLLGRVFIAHHLAFQEARTIDALVSLERAEQASIRRSLAWR